MAYTTIDDPTQYFDTTLWTGSGGARTISGLNHKPDLIWTKTRSVGYNHMWSDSSRGFNANSEIGSNSDAAEGGLSAETYGYKSGHTSDGWTMVDGTDTVDSQEDGNTNQPSVTYVGWTWAANGGTTTTNDASSTGVGTIDSVYQANTTAGFSIVTYTGTGSAGTIAHGLGVAPTLIIGKDRSDTSQWFVQHPAKGATHYGELDDTTAFADDANYFNDSTPTSTVFGIGSDGATGGTTNYVAYCFAPIQGYSKFGKYTGNGNADGPFIYLGFKPAWVMFKNTTTGHDWRILDNTRNTFNSNNTDLRPNTSEVESSSSDMDFLSNGIKIRDTDGDLNEDGSSHVYFAFAESPFVSSKGVPTTAR